MTDKGAEDGLRLAADKLPACVWWQGAGGRGAGSPGQGRGPGPEHGRADLNFKVDLQLPIQISGVLNWLLCGYAPFVVVRANGGGPQGQE